MASDDVCEGHGHKEIPAGYSATKPSLCRQALEKGKRRAPYGPEFGYLAAPAASVRTGVGGSNILLEIRQWAFEPTRKPEGAKDEDTLRIVDVAEDFANAPFAIGVSVARPVVRDRVH